jgi:C_GCAxxG_C_C family probable redox protein
MLCGVVSGSLMALGILRGRDNSEEKVDAAFEAAADFVSKFRCRFESVDCRALTGLDLSSSAQRKLMSIGKVKERRCRVYLEWALDELNAFLP